MAAEESQSSFGKYTLVERIAAGGMAEVYKAKMAGVAGFEKTFALKRILPHLAEDEGFVEMFVREANVAVKLAHSNIVQVFELGRIGDDYYIALEFVEGRDLKALIRQSVAKTGHGLPPAVAAFVCKEICSGLHHAHTATDDEGRPLGIVHRDISPHNVLVSWTGEVKVADFGIAKLQSGVRHTVTGMLKGKLAYMSPEQSMGDPDLDARSDVFATGVVLYECLTGLRPFEGQVDREIIRAVRETTPPPPSAVCGSPPELDAIVATALAKDPKERWQTAQEMGRALGRWLMKQSRPPENEELSRLMRELLGGKPISKSHSGKSDGTPVLPPADASVASLLPTVGSKSKDSSEVFALSDAKLADPSASTALKPPAAPTVLRDDRTPPPAPTATPSATRPSRGRSQLPLIGGLAVVALAVGLLAVPLASHWKAEPSPTLPLPVTTPLAAATTPAGAATPTILASAGSLSIDGSPKGALVTVDGAKAGRLGDPISLTGLAAGAHTLVTTADGFRPDTRTVTVGAAPASARIDLVRGKGEIRIGPPGHPHELYLKGITDGRESEADFANVPAGRYVADVSDGRKTAKVTIVVKDNRTTKVLLPDPLVDGLTFSP